MLKNKLIRRKSEGIVYGQNYENLVRQKEWFRVSKHTDFNEYQIKKKLSRKTL